MEVLTLKPLAQAKLDAIRAGFIDALRFLLIAKREPSLGTNPTPSGPA